MNANASAKNFLSPIAVIINICKKTQAHNFIFTLKLTPNLFSSFFYLFLSTHASTTTTTTKRKKKKCENIYPSKAMPISFMNLYNFLPCGIFLVLSFVSPPLSSLFCLFFRLFASAVNGAIAKKTKKKICKWKDSFVNAHSRCFSFGL